jgi:plasmid maintenance system antidote protein VapI
MIETGRITEFKQIFLMLPKSHIARALHTNNNRMTDLINDAGRITIEEIYTIASLLEIDYDKIHELLKTQYLSDMKVSDANKEDNKDAARNTNKVLNKIKKKK